MPHDRTRSVRRKRGGRGDKQPDRVCGGGGGEGGLSLGGLATKCRRNAVPEPAAPQRSGPAPRLRPPSQGPHSCPESRRAMRCPPSAVGATSLRKLAEGAAEVGAGVAVWGTANPFRIPETTPLKPTGRRTSTPSARRRGRRTSLRSGLSAWRGAPRRPHAALGPHSRSPR